MADPDLSKLKSQLLTSGIQKDNNALHQVIWGLITFIQKILSQLGISESIITVNNDSATSPNSRQVAAGSGINLMNDGRRLVISSVVFVPDYTQDYDVPVAVGTTVITGAP